MPPGVVAAGPVGGWHVVKNLTGFLKKYAVPNKEVCYSAVTSQCHRVDLNKKSLPRPKTTAA